MVVAAANSITAPLVIKKSLWQAKIGLMCKYADVRMLIDVQICGCADVQMFVNSDINAEL